MTTIQIRSVDDALAEAAKAEAARRQITLSDYLKLLIREDLESASATRRRTDAYRRIRTSPLKGRVSKTEVADALASAREELGLR